MESGTDPQAAPLRVGIAGFGISGAVFHAPLVDSTPGLSVSAVVTGNDERAAEVTAGYPGAMVVKTVEDLWGQIDLLVIATPNRSHAELALAAITRGVPVVIDKPLAATTGEGEQILGAGGRVTVFQNRRWDGDFLTLKRLLDDGALGRPVRLESRFERFRPETGDGWRESADPADGGGQLADLGAHLIDQAIELFGPPVSVYAEIDRRREGAVADDDTFVSLEHDDGVRSHLWMGKLAPLAGPRFRLTGFDGGAAIDGLDPQEAQLGSGQRPGDPGFGERDPGTLVTDDSESDLPILTGDYAGFYERVVGWLKGEGPPPVDPKDSLRVLRILDAARDSAINGRAVLLDRDGRRR